MPENLKEQALSYLSPQYQKIVTNFYEEMKLNKAPKDVGIYDEDFFKYMKTRVKRYNLPNEVGLWGYFPTYDERGLLKNIRLFVPNIIDEKTLLINIHEYAQAYEAYKNLGTVYNEDKKQIEEAKKKEKIYLEKKIRP